MSGKEAETAGARNSCVPLTGASNLGEQGGAVQLDEAKRDAEIGRDLLQRRKSLTSSLSIALRMTRSNPRLRKTMSRSAVEAEGLDLVSKRNLVSGIYWMTRFPFVGMSGRQYAETIVRDTLLRSVQSVR